MKKTYSKPEIMFESFTMSTNIAAGCEHTFGHYQRNVCGIADDTGEDIIFAEAAGSACNSYPADGLHNGFCYHLPTESDNLFNS